MPKDKPRLSDEQRIDIAEKCLVNTSNLLREAKRLSDDDGFPYAQFLIASALEEVLKSRYCIEEAAPDWKTWWHRFRSHESKFSLARLYWPDLPKGSTKSMLDLRERCVYVDVKPNGDPLTPHGLVNFGKPAAEMLTRWDGFIREEARKMLVRLTDRKGLSLPPIPK